MGSLLGEAPFIEDQDLIGVDDGAQAMAITIRVLDLTRSPMARCRCISFSGSSEAVASSRRTMGASFKMARAMDILLLFTPGQGGAPFSHHGIVSVIKLLNKFMAPRHFGGGLHLLPGGVLFAHADIVKNRILEKVDILKHHADHGVEVFGLHLPEIHPPMVMEPESTSQKRETRLVIVVFPLPEGPPGL